MFVLGAHDGMSTVKIFLMTAHREAFASGGNYDHCTSLPWHTSHRKR